MSMRSEEHTSELQSRGHLVCRLLLEKKKNHLHEPRTITCENSNYSPTTRTTRSHHPRHTTQPSYFNYTAPTDHSTLSLHDALPISVRRHRRPRALPRPGPAPHPHLIRLGPGPAPQGPGSPDVDEIGRAHV